MWHPSSTFCTQAVQSQKHNHFDRWLEKQPNKSSSNFMAFCMSLWKTRMLCCLLFTHYQQQYIFRRPLLVPPDRQDKFHEAEFHFKYNSLGHVLCFSFFLVVVSLTKNRIHYKLGWLLRRIRQIFTILQFHKCVLYAHGESQTDFRLSRFAY